MEKPKRWPGLIMSLFGTRRREKERERSRERERERDLQFIFGIGGRLD